MKKKIVVCGNIRFDIKIFKIYKSAQNLEPIYLGIFKRNIKYFRKLTKMEFQNFKIYFRTYKRPKIRERSHFVQLKHRYCK